MGIKYADPEFLMEFSKENLAKILSKCEIVLYLIAAAMLVIKMLRGAFTSDDIIGIIVVIMILKIIIVFVSTK